MSKQGLLRAILENPDDDLPRLVLADWLEENGDEVRARFIRLQCRRAQLGDEHPGAETLVKQDWELRCAHARSWQRELPAWARRLRCRFRRGFVAEGILTPKQFFEKLPSLRRRTPLEGIEIIDSSIDFSALANCPHVSGLKLLRLHGGWKWWKTDGGPNGVSPETVRTLAASPHLGSLRELELSDFPIDAAGAQALADAPHLSQLRCLNLHSCGLREAGLAALGRATFAGSLTELHLSCNFFRDAGVEVLSGIGTFEQLTNLNLDTNGIEAQGLLALSRAPFLYRLRRLDLMSGHFTGTELANLFASDRLGSLRYLKLDCCKVRASAFAASPPLANLAVLILTNAEQNDEDVKSMAGVGHWPSLSVLNLWANKIGDEGVGALARSPHFPALRDLRLGDNRDITDAGARCLVESPLGDRLVYLGFWRTGISQEGARLLRERFGERVNLG
jgi:uncharacterized protein (TIGR02996 family)